MKPLRAIIVEDVDDDFELVVLELERYGFAVDARRVTTAAALEEALREQAWDAVLSDYRLPSFSGPEALALVRSSPFELPFILITAALGDELAVEIMRLGADDFVLKDRLARLGHSVDRAVREYGERRERRRAQAARKEAEELLEKATRLNGLGRVAATIAHEFNNVLMGIQPFVDILRSQAGGQPRMQQSIERIAASVKRGKRVTSEILRFTRQSEPFRRPLDVASLIADLGDEARELLGPQVEFVSESEPGLVVSADSTGLQQVFMNLIVNARDAVAGLGRISITARREGGENGDELVHLALSDSGCGMSAETMQHVFEPLFTTKKSGTGLGLALAHRIVEQHGGRMSVQSAVGAGTTFHVFLPVSREPVQPIVPRVAAERPPCLRSVVLVEDDPTIAAGVVALLALDEIRVEVATTGGDALPTIERVSPDAVVLDVGLPDCDGTQVYEAIERRWPDLPVIFATGHLDASRLSTYLQRPNVGHILKPYEVTRLYQSLAELTRTPAH